MKEQTPTVSAPKFATVPDVAQRPTVSAAKALGLPDKFQKDLTTEASRIRQKYKIDAHIPAPKPEPKPEIKPTLKKKKEEAAPEPEKKTEATETPAASPAAATPEPEKKSEATPAPEAPKVDAKTAEYEKQLKDQAAQLEEMKKKLEALSNPKPAAKEEPAKKEPTSEEKKQQELERQNLRQGWMDGELKNIQLAPLTEEDHDTILAGGKDALAKFNEIRSKDISQAILRARETMYADLTPMIQEFDDRLKSLTPVMEDYQNLQRIRVEETFKKTHADLANHLPAVKSVANSLLEQYPNECASMDETQFFTEVAKQTRDWLKSLGVQLTTTPSAPAPTAAPVAAPAATPAAPLPGAAPSAAPAVPAALQAPAAPKAPVPAAPAPSAPSASAGGKGPSIHKSIAASLTY